MLWVVVLLFVAVVLAALHLLLVKPFFQGKLPTSVGKWVGRTIHYPKLPFVIASFALGLRKSSYWSKVDDSVYLGCLPTFWNYHLLCGMRIRAVVNMCDEAYGPLTFYKEAGIEQLYLPTVDHTEPPVEDLKRAVHFIEQHVQQGNNVLIHCMAGRGRSAAVALAWLLYRYKQLDLDKAQELLSSKRTIVRSSLNKQHSLISYYTELISQRAAL